jgi:cobyric acid synthase
MPDNHILISMIISSGMTLLVFCNQAVTNVKLVQALVCKHVISVSTNPVVLSVRSKHYCDIIMQIGMTLALISEFLALVLNMRSASWSKWIWN